MHSAIPYYRCCTDLSVAEPQRTSPGELRVNGLQWLLNLNPTLRILAAGRLLSQVGTGFTLFYLPIFFVNQVGLSATAVGLALGSASISGMMGRFWGGTMVDSPRWGRRKTLLIAMIFSSLGAFGLALAQEITVLTLGNILAGIGLGLYWPATEAVVADLSKPEERSEAFAITRLADNLGLGLGVVLGGALIALANAYRLLFAADGLSFLVFFGILYVAIPETLQSNTQQHTGLGGWRVALTDRPFVVYILVNILITTYLAQINSTLPLYLKNFAQQGNGYNELIISILFAGHLCLAIALQLPIARRLRSYSYAHALAISLAFWALGFALVWACGIVSQGGLVWAALALGIMAIAMTSYTPIASALVVALAPTSLRGIYLSLNSQCWAIGYLIGPALGGIAMDQPRFIADLYWLALAASIVLGVGLLFVLDRQLKLRSVTQ
ncbi:MAG TPA: MFS transporter [Stenomitos sp.]